MDAADEQLSLIVCLWAPPKAVMCCPPELGAMTLLLKTPYVLDTRHRDLSLN